MKSRLYFSKTGIRRHTVPIARMIHNGSSAVKLVGAMQAHMHGAAVIFHIMTQSMGQNKSSRAVDASYSISSSSSSLNPLSTTFFIFFFISMSILHVKCIISQSIQVLAVVVTKRTTIVNTRHGLKVFHFTTKPKREREKKYDTPPSFTRTRLLLLLLLLLLHWLTALSYNHLLPCL